MSPTPWHVYTYLNTFLTDGRIIDIPWILRQFLVRCIIVPLRFMRSASNYAAIWNKSEMNSSMGSPEMYHSVMLQRLLQQALNEDRSIIGNRDASHSAAAAIDNHAGNAGNTSRLNDNGAADSEQKFIVELGMCYGQPSIRGALDMLHFHHRVKQIVVVPLFPQYASATVGSVHQRVMNIVSQWHTIPNMSFVSSYALHPSYIDSIISNTHDWSARVGVDLLHDVDHILFSFHGLPKRHIRKSDRCPGNTCCLQKMNVATASDSLTGATFAADEQEECCMRHNNDTYLCYRSQCVRQCAVLANRMGIDPNRYTVSFQSRLGTDAWLTPYTSKAVEQLAKKGKKRVAVFSLSFLGDCLETLHELDIELKEEFIEHGGQELWVVNCLNEHPQWVQGFKKIVLEFTNTALLQQS